MSSFSSSSKRDWRRTPAGGTSTRGKVLKRAVLTTCLLVMAVWLVWLLWPSGHPTLRWAVLEKGQYDTEIRPVPSFWHVIDGFEQWVPAEQLPAQDGSKGQGNQLADINEKNDCDVLVVYVSAHGVSGVSTNDSVSADDGAAGQPSAFLLESHFNAPSSQQGDGRLAVVDLLERISESPAKVKLLVLDAVHITTDPWLGMVVNEFPRLLEQELERFDDPSLWILSSSGPLERSHFCYAQGQSIFSYYLTQGLGGEADRKNDDDRNVDLDELFYFVRDRVADWVDRQTDETQTPRLLKAGKGAVEKPEEGIVLLHIPKAREDAAEGDAEKKEDAAASEDQGPAAAGETKADAPPADSHEGNGDGQVEEKKSPADNKETSSDNKETSSDNKKSPADNKETSSDNKKSPADNKKTSSDNKKSPADNKKTSSNNKKSPADNKKTSSNESSPGSGQEKAPKATGDGESSKTGSESAGAKSDASRAESGKSDSGGLQGPRADEPADKPPARWAEEELPSDWDDKAQPEKIRYLLDKAWKWRDAVQARKDGHSWSPVDYAPHLWREYQELLLGYEWRWRYAISLDKGKLRELESLAKVRRFGQASHRGQSRILSRLEKAETQFNQSDVKAQFDEHPEFAGVEQAVKLKNDLFFAVPYYLRWHAWAAWASPGVDSLEEPISDTIGKLAELVDDLERLERPDAPDRGGRSPTSDPQELLEKLGQTIDELKELRRKLQQDELGNEADKLLNEADKPSNEPDQRSVVKLETLLSTPLLPGKLRIKLLDALKDVDEGSTDLSPEVGSAVVPSPADRTPRWAALMRHAELQENAIRKLDDPDFTIVQLPSAQQPEEDLWKQNREAGAELKAYYAKLPQRINEGLSEDDSRTLSDLRRRLPMVDPRDVRNRLDEGPDDDYRFAMMGPIEWIALEGVHVNVQSNKAMLVLAEDKPTDFELTITISGRKATAVSINPDFNPSQVLIGDSEDSEERLSLRRDTWKPLTLGSNGKTTLRLSARARRGSSGFDPLTFKVKADNVTKTYRIPLELGRPDVVNLVVQRLLDAEDNRKRVENSGASIVKCPAFPNRLTEFVLGLENLSGKERTVTVQFWSAPRPPKRWDDRTRRGPLSGIGRPLNGFKQLTEPLDVTLPATDKITPIKFRTAEEEEGGEGNDASEDPASATGDPKEADADRGPVIHGLACTIHDEQTGPLPTQWIDLEPRAPSTYLYPALRYSKSRREVVIELEPKKDAKVLPAFSEDDPIKMVLETAGGLTADMRMINYGEIAQRDGKAILKVENIDLDKTPEIEAQLTVDGYPRAFVFKRFSTNLDRLGEVNHNLEKIEITFPEREPVEAYKIEDGQIEPPLVVHFRLDTPHDAFEEEGEVVRIEFGEEHEFYSQRQEEIRLAEPISEGILKIFTTVGDYRVTLNPRGRVSQNQEVPIRAQLFLRGDLRAEDEVEVILDGAPPQLLVTTTRRPVAQGTELRVTVQAKDASGPPKIDFGFDMNDDKTLADDEKVDAPGSPGMGGEWTYSLPTEELTPGKTYGLIVHATDKVKRTTKETKPITIGPPEDPEGKGPKKFEKVTVQIQAHLDGDPATASRWSSLTISGLPVPPQKDRATGTHTFKGVPPGSYKLTAKGIYGNRIKPGSLDITVTDDKPVQRFNIPME